MQRTRDFLQFVSEAPTPFHAVHLIASRLLQLGFIPLAEQEPWTLSPGSRYFVTRNGSSLLAFTIPALPFDHFQIVASHDDSPCFKLKPLPESGASGHYVRLNVEKYGGMIMSTWFDRPLSIAGRILTRDGNRLTSHLVNLNQDSVLIPSMPIHFNREVNDGYKFNPQVDLLPLYANESSASILDAVALSCQVTRGSIIGHDLYLYNRVPGSIWGKDNAFFSSGRIDDLECAYCSLESFLAASGKHANLYALFDNEEVGSRSRQGADSPFLADTLKRICGCFGLDPYACIASSFMISADNAHAVHPNHPEKYDEQNRCFMNEGVVVKYNSSQKYATDAVSDAVFSEICSRAGVPVQHFSNRSDIAGGSTLGTIANSHVSMSTVDIGLAQLAMHSAYETAGTKDISYLIDALTGFYRADIQIIHDNVFELA